MLGIRSVLLGDEDICTKDVTCTHETYPRVNPQLPHPTHQLSALDGAPNRLGSAPPGLSVLGGPRPGRGSGGKVYTLTYMRYTHGSKRYIVHVRVPSATGCTHRPVRSRTIPYVPSRPSQLTRPSTEALWRVPPRSRRHLELGRWPGGALSGRQCALRHRTARGRIRLAPGGSYIVGLVVRLAEAAQRVCAVLPWPGDVPLRRSARSLRV